jgi:SAM-dependent methyltransferase
MSAGVPLPPPDLNFVGDGDFEAVGREFLRYFIEFGGLAPSHHVLDVGCGIGRMARPLAGYLDHCGTYDGFDIVERGIEWCQQNITAVRPNFRFRRADLHNPSYNPSGTLDASEYVFPYEPESFDFVFLTSVFTHMLPGATENYVYEINRVLRVGGRCLATFFLQNAETRRLAEAGKGALIFLHRRDGYWVDNEAGPDENAVSYDEDYVLDLYWRYGFEIDGPVRRGNWCGRTEYVSAHDIVVARKVRSLPLRRRERRVLAAISRWRKRLAR